MRKLSYLWAKTGECDQVEYHPLLLHLLDVAACADAILAREPEWSRKRMGSILGMDWEIARAWLLLIIACHDLGKACPGFQLKWETRGKELLKKGELHVPGITVTDLNHGFVSQYALAQLLKDSDWQEDLAELCADAVGCHHGTRSTETTLDKLAGNRFGVDERNWKKVWVELFNELRSVFEAGRPPTKKTLNGPEFMLLAGLTSFADWIGSNQEFFTFGTREACENLPVWFQTRRSLADTALETIGWNYRSALLPHPVSFEEAFPHCTPPRDLQCVMAKVAQDSSVPGVILVEAPMGEGKTEAAFYAHLEMQRKLGHRGMYVAMPTKATGNAMFERTISFLRSQSNDRTLDMQLLHGATQLNETFQRMKFAHIYSDENRPAVAAANWFTHKKRALLSEYGVGTVDQALLTILPVRHYFVRLWGLANRVVIFDEIHAYDAYTGTLLFHLIRWLRALGSTVILLSATVPPEFRRRLAEALGTNLPFEEISYPRVTVWGEGKQHAEQIHVKPEASRRLHISLEQLDTSVMAIVDCLSTHGCGDVVSAVIVNTVQRAQDLYAALGEGDDVIRNGECVGKVLTDGTEVNLFHARFPANRRQIRENHVLENYGKGERVGRHILVATQVAEQSLDLDFDMLITDLAPIDLVLQRAGRMWRHGGRRRNIGEPRLFVAGLAGATYGPLGEPLWWDTIYRKDILIRTWELLRSPKYRMGFVLPDDLEPLVETVYEGLEMPSDEEIVKQLQKAEIENDGELLAQRAAAHQSIIGLPDDASWKDTARLCLFDEDEPGKHCSLVAQTRLGEDSVSGIPLRSGELAESEETALPFERAKDLASRVVSLSRKSVVGKLRGFGVPVSWKNTPLLRNCYPLVFDDHGIWVEDRAVRLDSHLGIVYRKKEDG